MKKKTIAPIPFPAHNLDLSLFNILAYFFQSLFQGDRL